MSIKFAKAISYYDMAHLMKLVGRNAPFMHDPDRLNDFVKQFDKIWIVSMRDPGVPALFNYPKEKQPYNLLQMEFHDIHVETEEDKAAVLRRGEIYPNEEHARTIVEFIKKAHSHDSQSNDLLLTHFMMGIARSGAVADYTTDLLGLDRKSFEALNPQIRPNKTMYKLLRKVYQSFNKIRIN